MARENTNKHYSLRKLKKGTASVAVALCVLGAGLANQTEVKAEENPRVTEARAEVIAEMLRNNNFYGYPFGHLQFGNLLSSTIRDNNNLKETLNKKEEEVGTLLGELDKIVKKNIESGDKYKKEIGQIKAEADAAAQKALDALNNKNEQIAALVDETNTLKEINEQDKNDLETLTKVLDEAVAKNIESTNKYKKEIGQLKAEAEAAAQKALQLWQQLE